jgi:uncharacterized protein (TIGR02246 family)
LLEHVNLLTTTQGTGDVPRDERADGYSFERRRARHYNYVVLAAPASCGDAGRTTKEDPMRLTFALLCSLAVAVTAPGQTQGSRERDEPAIRDLVARYNAARDDENAAAIRALFTADADQLVSSGEWRRGRDQLVEGMLRSSRSNPGDRTLAVEAVRFVAADVAVADARYEIAGAAGGDTRRMWSTFVAVRTAEGWRLSAIRNMLPTR